MCYTQKLKMRAYVVLAICIAGAAAAVIKDYSQHDLLENGVRVNFIKVRFH